MPGAAPADTIGAMTAPQKSPAAPPRAGEHVHRRILMRIIAPLATLLASLALAAVPAHAHRHPSRLPRGTVWVTDKNPTAGTVAAFDARTGELRGTIPVGLSPIGIVAPHGTDDVYVSNEGSNTMSVIDRHSLREVRTIPMGSKPHHLIASRDGRFVYVGEFGQNSIGVIDTRTGTVRHLVTGDTGALTHAVFVSRDGRTLYATNAGTANEIVALDARTGAIRWSLPIGKNPSEILVTDDERTAYVSVRNENVVKVVDLLTRTILAAVPIGTAPDTLRLTDDQATLVVTLRGTPAQISLMNTCTLAVTPVMLDGTTTGHHWLSRDGRFAYVALVGPPTSGLVVLDNDTGRPVATWAYPGAISPHGVYYERRELR
jgi:YVTN family beta-propeller protein